jgi:nucleoside diphosphate kinase
LEFITSDYAVGLELVAPDAINRWRKAIGPTNSDKAKK